MTRHGKNCTAGAVYTYHEKRKDTGNVTLVIIYLSIYVAVALSLKYINTSYIVTITNASLLTFPAASGYGTQSVRLGKDAIKDFDCCCLSLQPCRDPVVT